MQGQLCLHAQQLVQKYAKAVLVLITITSLKYIFWNICKVEKAHATKHGILFNFFF